MKNLIIITIITLTIASSCKNQEKQTNNKKLETNSVLKLTTEQIQNIDLEYTQLKSDFISKSPPVGCRVSISFKGFDDKIDLYFACKDVLSISK